MTAYYNENDPKAAAWLRELIRAGHIAPGEVDERSIADVTPLDVAGYTQCHFFAGIGGWSYALRLARWSDSRRVWTGSCPCQPFSDAGKGGGFSDERHLWPAWHHLIDECRPAIIFGEQVASKDGLNWFDLVHSDLEISGYSVGVADLCAASVGAPHIRQRLYFVAEPESQQSHRSRDARRGRRQLADGSSVGDADNEGSQGRGERRDSADQQFAWPSGLDSLVGGPGVQRRERRQAASGGHVDDRQTSKREQDKHGPSIAGSYWSGAEFIACRDGKSRPVEPGTFPLAHGIPHRVGLLRGYGNAIVAPLAAAFIEAYDEIE